MDPKQSMATNPRLRTDIEIVPGQVQGKRVLIVRDPMGLIEKPIALNPDLASILALLDGTRSLRDIQYELMRRQGGVLVSSDQIQKMLDQLDAAMLLDNERYHRAFQAMAAAYTAETVRRPIHAGQGYPADPKKLHEYLDAVLARGKPSDAVAPKDIVAVAAPHIDPKVGERVYAAAYGPLRGAEFQRAIILGIMHRSDDGLFSISQKAYATPYGIARTDADLVARLREAGEAIVSDHDLAHRTEHSIEFQVIFLQHVLGRADIAIVPILCGSFSHFLGQWKRPSEIPSAADLFAVIREALGDTKHKTILVAGVDLSHIGPKFGDHMSGRAIAEESEKHDRALLDALCRMDPGAFWAESRRVEDRYHVCGFPALACMTEILKDCTGHLLDYEIWHEEPTRSAVSFAAVAFTSR